MWKALKDIGCTRYMINTQGDIINSESGRYIKGSFDRDGYNLVSLYTEESNYIEVKSFRRHVLVAQTFLVNPNDCRTVNHRDGNKQNNCVANLEWASDKQNINHAHRNNLYKQRIDGDKYYEVQKAISNGYTYKQIRDKYALGVNTISRIKKTMISWEEYYA